MPYVSEKQKKWMHKNKPEMAAKWDKEEKKKKKGTYSKEAIAMAAERS